MIFGERIDEADSGFVQCGLGNGDIEKGEPSAIVAGTDLPKGLFGTGHDLLLDRLGLVARASRHLTLRRKWSAVRRAGGCHRGAYGGARARAHRRAQRGRLRAQQGRDRHALRRGGRGALRGAARAEEMAVGKRRESLGKLAPRAWSSCLLEPSWMVMRSESDFWSCSSWMWSLNGDAISSRSVGRPVAKSIAGATAAVERVLLAPALPK